MLVLHSYLLSKSFPLCGYAFLKSIHQLMGIWIVSTFCLLWRVWLALAECTSLQILMLRVPTALPLRLTDVTCLGQWNIHRWDVKRNMLAWRGLSLAPLPSPWKEFSGCSCLFSLVLSIKTCGKDPSSKFSKEPSQHSPGFRDRAAWLSPA